VSWSAGTLFDVAVHKLVHSYLSWTSRESISTLKGNTCSALSIVCHEAVLGWVTLRSLVECLAAMIHVIGRLDHFFLWMLAPRVCIHKSLSVCTWYVLFASVKQALVTFDGDISDCSFFASCIDLQISFVNGAGSIVHYSWALIPLLCYLIYKDFLKFKFTINSALLISGFIQTVDSAGHALNLIKVILFVFLLAHNAIVLVELKNSY